MQNAVELVEMLAHGRREPGKLGIAVIDLTAEKARLAKEIARIAGEIKKCEGKLGNANFVANAPAEVVAQERQRIVDWNVALTALREQAAKLEK